MRTASYVAVVIWLSIEWLASCVQTVDSDAAPASATDKREFYRIGRDYHGRNLEVDAADRFKRQFYRIGRDFQPSLDDDALAARDKREFYRIGRDVNGWNMDDVTDDRLKREFYRIGRDYQSAMDDDIGAAKDKRQFYRIGRDYNGWNLDDQTTDRLKRQFYRIGRAYQPYQDKRFLRFGRSAPPNVDDFVLQPDAQLYRRRRSAMTDDHSTQTHGRSKRSAEQNDQLVSGAAEDETTNKDVEKREADSSDLVEAKRFIRFGRGDPEAVKRFMRFGKRFMRFGRNLSQDKRFMRFGKRFMRLGRLPEADKSYVRFGKRSGVDAESDQVLLDGEFDDDNDGSETDKRFMRFGKRFMRFGKRDNEADSESEKRFMRFGKRGEDKRFMRFGKRGLTGDEENEKRFMRFGRDGQDKRFMRFGKRATQSVDSESQNGLIQS